MRMIAIHAQTERKRLDRSVRCAEKRRPWARKQRLRGLIRPDPAVCATAGAACGRKSLSSARIQAIFTSNDTPLGECRLKAIEERLPAEPRSPEDTAGLIQTVIQGSCMQWLVEPEGELATFMTARTRMVLSILYPDHVFG